MKRHRFFIDPRAIQGRFAYIEDASVCGQISKVLRLRAGDEVILLDGLGFEYAARLVEVNARKAQAEILHRQMNKNEAELKITLYQALVKKDKFEWVLQKCTEVGVTHFVAVQAARSEKTGLNEERAKKVLKEAAEQSERAIIPELSEIKTFESALRKAVTPDTPTMILDASGESIVSSKMARTRYTLNVFVGPEGGWDEAELEAVRGLMREGYPLEIVNLGPRVLRAETAGLVAAGIVLNR
ncbi:MAG: RsmE family RNA methyltransferase [bacterium]|nr:RsmE family RNA methyltransferase [bacterium]